jgi:predicted lipoprotein with Yx(FWY)xxD motif
MSRVRRHYAAGVVVCLLGVLVGVAGCGAAQSKAKPIQATTTAAAPTVRLHAIAGLGEVLVDSHGKALYMFPPDHRRAVTCTGPCAGSWPPLRLAKQTTPSAGPGVHADLLGSDPDPDGGRVLTYNGWPLYTYVADLTSRQAVGQALNLNGGYWYVLRASGQPVVPAGAPVPR